MREPELAKEARSFIGSAQQQISARGDCSHAHTRRDAHLASLTPLTGAARAQLSEARARAQHRLRGALQACGALIIRHITMGAYIPNCLLSPYCKICDFYSFFILHYLHRITNAIVIWQLCVYLHSIQFCI